MKNRILAGLFAFCMTVAGAITGALIQHYQDANAIETAMQKEAQANGLEDECKAILKDKNEYVWRNYGMPHSVINFRIK